MSRKSLLSRINPRLKWRGIQGLHYNEQGVSAVEFAIIAPVMVLIYFGVSASGMPGRSASASAT